MSKGFWCDGFLPLPAILVLAQLPALATAGCMIACAVQYIGGNDETILVYAAFPIVFPWIALLATIVVAAASAALARLGSLRHKLARSIVAVVSVIGVYGLCWVISAIAFVPVFVDVMSF